MKRAVWERLGLGAIACFAALLAMSAPTRAEGPDAKTPAPIDWTPGNKLDWGKYVGKKPDKPAKPGEDFDALTVYTFKVVAECHKDGTYKVSVVAQFVPDKSWVSKPSAAILYHEQVHFEIAQKHAATAQEAIVARMKEKCKCGMSGAEIAALDKANAEDANTGLNAANSENEAYDQDTNHGSQSNDAEIEKQKKWAHDTASALGQKDPEYPKDGSQPQPEGQPQPQGQANSCSDCEKAEADRLKKVAALQAKIDPLNKQISDLFNNQIDPVQTDISHLNADIATNQAVLNDPNAKSGAKSSAKGKISSDNGKLKTDEAKLAPLKAKKEKLEKERADLEEQIQPLLTPIKCPKCAANPGNSSYSPLSDGFASNAPVTGGGNSCPPPSSVYFPGTPLTETYTVSFTVPFITDSGKYCTYDNVPEVPAPVYYADDGGSIIPQDPTDVPKQVNTPKTPDTPQTPKTPQTPETPKTPDDPPPTAKTPPPETPPVNTTTDNPPDQPTNIPDTVFVKATEAVLEGQPAGEPVQGQVVKLLPIDKPGLPGSGGSKAAQDTGFDKSPVQCTTGANGECRADVAKGERATYKLPTRAASGSAKQNYRIELAVKQVSGGVMETTRSGGKAPDLANLARGAAAAASEFKIGNRTFARLRGYADAGTSLPLREIAAKASDSYEEDYCRDKQPGTPLEHLHDVLDGPAHALPEASIHLRIQRRAAR